MSEKFTFFWHGPFSQWYRQDFVVEGVTYNCAEQYMMAAKAKLFEDDETLDKIMASTSPKEQKQLGREVKNFDKDKWDAVARDLVEKGNYAKFTQNNDLKKMLLETIGTTLVEASPYDKIWGIGMDDKNPLALNRNTWKGLNWLGEVLTRVRDRIVKESLGF